jgi:primosomal protein N' (replication factor Y)
MKRRIAQVVFNLPIKTRFDYLVPEKFATKIDIGSRVLAPFANIKKIGYVELLKEKSKFRKLRSIISLIDAQPIIEKEFIELLRIVSNYYCCSLGEMIETSLPASVKKSKRISIIKPKDLPTKDIKGTFQVSVLYDLDKQRKWKIYFRKIKNVIYESKSVIFLVPEINYIKNIYDKFKDIFKNNIAILHGKQSRQKALQEWIRIKEGRANIVIGVISAIFAPVRNLGLIIIEDEDSYTYKQNQSPHYHAREVALIRAKKAKASVILSSQTISVESYLEVKRKKYKLIKFGKKNRMRPEIQILDMKYERLRHKKKNLILSALLEKEIYTTLSLGGKIMLFLNRKGFSTYIYCRSCGYTLKCPRCNVSLTYHYERKFLRCRFCNHRTEVISICPNCQASYMRYFGSGTEKLESEMHRLFPQAKIKRWDEISKISKLDYDILISTQIGLRQENISVDLLGVLRPELSLNRIDFRAAEKTFSLLYRLSKLTKTKMIIQTNNPDHYSIQSIYKDNPNYFYKQELEYRKELDFPPFKHLVQIILRGKRQQRVKSVSKSLFEELKLLNKKKDIEIFEPIPSIPSKLRGNFYWNILLKASSVKNICFLIREPVLKYKNKSGVITTVNVDI